MKVFASTDDWRMLAAESRFDSIILPVAARYNSLRDAPLNSRDVYDLIPPSLKWFIATYTGRIEREEIKDATHYAASITPGLASARDMTYIIQQSHIPGVLKPKSNVVLGRTQVVGLGVVSGFLSSLSPNPEGWEKTGNYLSSPPELVNAIKAALGCVAVRHKDTIERSKDLIRVAIAPLFAEGGHTAANYTGPLSLPVSYTRRMMDIISPLEPDMDVTVFNNWGTHFTDRQANEVRKVRGVASVN